MQSLAYGGSFSSRLRKPRIREPGVSLEVNCCREHGYLLTKPWSKSVHISRIVLAMFALAIAWTGFRLANHRHTGVLRTLVEIRQFLRQASNSSTARPAQASAPSGPQHSVHLSWKASTSAVAGYNVYRRSASGFTRINSAPVHGTTYIDTSVQPGQTYYYVTKAVGSTGAESAPSNEVQAMVPSP